MNENLRLLENGKLQLDSSLSVEDALDLPKHLTNVTSDYISGQRTEKGKDSFWFIIRICEQFYLDDFEISKAIESILEKRRKCKAI